MMNYPYMLLGMFGRLAVIVDDATDYMHRKIAVQES